MTSQTYKYVNKAYKYCKPTLDAGNLTITRNAVGPVASPGMGHVPPPPWSLRHALLFLATRSALWPKICRKCDSGRGSAPDLAGGAHDVPPDPLVGCGADTPFHTPHHSAPRCSRLRRLDRRAPWHQILATPLSGPYVFCKTLNC